jgi:hypothetical protein
MGKWWMVFAVALSLQAVFWWHTVDYYPRMEVVPPVPSEVMVEALSLGDKQAFFRILALNLQNFGDSYGRFTPLKDYNYRELARWFYLLDKLDHRSDHIPSLASYYFSQTQHVPDVEFLVRYLEHHTHNRLQDKWWWRTQAVYLANHKLKRPQWAMELAKPLTYEKGLPIWVRQLPAFLYEQRGEFGDALMIMEHVREHADDLTPGELNFIRYFIEERIQALDKASQGE